MKKPSGLLRLASVLALLAGFATETQAAERVVAEGVELRLLTGLVLGDTAQSGLEIALAPGWKTYWRSPGDSGIPPQIDTSASGNVASVAVDYPAPARFADGAGESVGYVGPVVLPMRVRLADPARPARLSAKILLGVCREICVPVDAALAVTIDPKAPPQPRAVAAIAAAKARLPVPVERGADLSVVEVRREAGGGTAALVLRVSGGNAGETVDLFAEGPEGWALPQAERLRGSEGESLWRLPLEGLPPGAKPEGATLRFTMTAGKRATEQVWTLD